MQKWVHISMFPTARILANGINPLFAVLVLAAPLARPRLSRSQTRAYFAASAAGIGLGLLLAEEGKRHQVWPGHPGFPSGHETFALACATCLACRNPRWLWAAIPLAALLGWALIKAHFHQTSEVFGALLTGPPPVLLCYALLLRRLPRSR
jgi:membrane-associated phospholipid phosphatase